MNKTIPALAAALMAALFQARAQPAGYYRCPLDIPVFLSANYGEMRTNRFHTGIDIKTQGVTGIPLLAAADGYVSRVTVAPSGYGRALYITHPNGTMTVYAHMDRFTDEIENYLREERYRQKRSDIDAFPDAGRFPVAKGDRIGFSGNSGSSQGPHLHFEVRRLSDSKTLNVMSHGWIKAKDDVPPRIIKLYHIDVDTIAGVPVHSKPRAYDVKKNGDGNYSLVRNSPLNAGPASYFVIETTDRKSDVNNTFGIYRARLYADGEEVLTFEKDGLLFNDNRYCCASVYYDVQAKSRNEAVILAVRNGNNLPMYKKAVNRGAVGLYGKERSDIRITVEDDALNAVSLSFAVVRDDSRNVPERPEGRAASDRRDFIYSDGGMGVIIPKGALYEPLFYAHTVAEIAVGKRADSICPLSPVYLIGDGAMPLHRAMQIAIEADVPSGLQSRACLARVSDKGVLSYAGGTYANGYVKGSSRDFGMFCAVSDTVPPVIKASFADGADLSKTNSVTFTASDNFSGIGYFTASIDGEWVILERDSANRKFTHNFDPCRLEKGRIHTFTMTVRDGAGNTATSTTAFFR